jgi:hypothetical protein
MSHKKPAKPYWEMTTTELRAATQEFDKEFVADRAQPLTPAMRIRWKRAQAKLPPPPPISLDHRTVLSE